MTTISLLYRAAALAAIPIALGACATSGGEAGGTVTRTVPHRSDITMSPSLADTVARAAAPAAENTDAARLFKGSGVLVKGQQPGGKLPPGQVTQPAGGGVVLNFEGADLREVIRNILGDILNESYTIDQSVGGTVTIRTSSGIPRDALIATLETLLRMNGAAMVKEGGLYKIVPQAAAVRGNLAPQLGNSARSLPAGYSVQIVPLRYIGVREMARILEPFVKDATAIRPDDLRNLLVLSGTERELKHLLDTIDTFDVDWMAGMSVGLFTLQSADVKTVGQELDKIIGDRNLSPLTGILRIIPMERLNALLVITPQPAYLEEAKKWIERLDRSGGEASGLRFFVFNLQNQRAEKLAPLLQQAFSGRPSAAAPAAAPTVAPGTQAGTITTPPAFQAQAGAAAPAATQVPTPAAALAAARAAAASAAGAGGGVVRNVQVVADKDNNTILIVATQSEYSVIEAALKKLDVPSRQVVIEVTIAQVALSDDLKYGVEWYFTNGAKQAGGLFRANTVPGNLFDVAASAAVAGIGPVVPGFSYLLAGLVPGGVTAALTMLGTAGDTKVVANPHVAALDNQKATIKVGDRIPICQETYVGSTTGATNNAVTTTSQYVDTGVLLQVTPHINAGGLVQLEVQAEVSIPGATTRTCEAPPINTRSVQSILSVQSGQTMVMGGLISDRKILESNGLPLLSKIPVIGALFGTQSFKDERTELVLFITPRVVENEYDVKGVVEDLRKRMERLEGAFPGSSKPWGGSLVH
ncbi:MAG: type II secretion system secretin GspD [Betaproteobacteria bacterium]|nr:type II secretion system secretin GspD [Betaproteobacteria bacterium]